VFRNKIRGLIKNTTGVETFSNVDIWTDAVENLNGTFHTSDGMRGIYNAVDTDNRSAEVYHFRPNGLGRAWYSIPVNPNHDEAVAILQTQIDGLKLLINEDARMAELAFENLKTLLPSVPYDNTHQHHV